MLESSLPLMTQSGTLPPDSLIRIYGMSVAAGGAYSALMFACLTMASLAPVSAIGMAASCGAPRRQPRNPARDVGPEFLVLGPKRLSQHRLLVRQDKGVEGEPHEPAVNHETPVAEQDPLAQNDGDDGNVDRIAHVAIETRHHEVLRRSDRRRRADRKSTRLN